MASTSPPFAAFSAHSAACALSPELNRIGEIILRARIARFSLLFILAAYLIGMGKRG